MRDTLLHILTLYLRYLIPAFNKTNVLHRANRPALWRTSQYDILAHKPGWLCPSILVSVFLLCRTLILPYEQCPSCSILRFLSGHFSDFSQGTVQKAYFQWLKTVKFSTIGQFPRPSGYRRIFPEVTLIWQICINLANYVNTQVDTEQTLFISHDDNVTMSVKHQNSPKVRDNWDPLAHKSVSINTSQCIARCEFTTFKNRFNYMCNYDILLSNTL